MSDLERYRVMAIDFGTKRIGIAVSDEMRMLASARGVIPNNDLAMKALRELVTRDNVRLVLLGLPKTMSNTDSDMTTQVRAFEQVLSAQMAKLDVKVEMRDERFTSMMANANIALSGLGKKKKEDKVLRDEEAARILLQEYLDSAR